MLDTKAATMLSEMEKQYFKTEQLANKLCKFCFGVLGLFLLCCAAVMAANVIWVLWVKEPFTDHLYPKPHHNVWRRSVRDVNLSRDRRQALDDAGLDCMERFIKVSSNLFCFNNATLAAERANTPIPRHPKCNFIQMQKEQSAFQAFYYVFCQEKNSR